MRKNSSKLYNESFEERDITRLEDSSKTPNIMV